MTKFKVGDLAKVTRRFKSNEGPDRLTWVDGDMDAFVGKTCQVTAISSEGHVQLKYGFDRWYFYPFVLEHVAKRPVARILTEKILVNGVKCRKITGFEGILGRDALPKTYTEGRPVFWYEGEAPPGAHVFNGACMDWQLPDDSCEMVRVCLPPGVKIDVGQYGFCGMNVGDVWPETTYQELLTWLKRAGSRLAKIRQQEREAWSGSGADEI